MSIRPCCPDHERPPREAQHSALRRLHGERRLRVWLQPRVAHREGTEVRCAELREEVVHGRDSMAGLTSLALRPCGSVSYTHLRAHETDSYLVCRLLLE